VRRLVSWHVVPALCLCLPRGTCRWARGSQPGMRPRAARYRGHVDPARSPAAARRRPRGPSPAFLMSAGNAPDEMYASVTGNAMAIGSFFIVEESTPPRLKNPAAPCRCSKGLARSHTS